MALINSYPKAERVFHYFEEISKIPRGSTNTAAIADYLIGFAKLHGLYSYKDSSDNVLIRKAATAGLENHPCVIVQGHSDIVAEKLPELQKDMTKEGLDLYRDGDFLRARGTTLGADDGIALAYMLALLEAEDIPHPEIEALITSDEEIGLIGAAAFDKSLLRGRILINIDSDMEGIFTVGCAGGVRTDTLIPVKRSALRDGEKAYTLTVSGLLGGHSGAEIDKGRANANKLGFELLDALKAHRIRLACAEGGRMDNAITRDFTASFTALSDPSADFAEAARKIKDRYSKCDPDISLSLTEAELDLCPCDEESTGRIISAANETHYGIVSMSKEIPTLVETSQNIGITKLCENEFKLCTSIRSEKSEKKAALVEKQKDIAIRHGGSFSCRGDYPGWEYKKDSHIRDVACDVYRELYGKEAEVITIHAGLECGLFSDAIEGLDCISLGPDNFDIHTTEERLSISSACRVWEFLKAVLSRL